jgi:hypothetical protein
MNYFCRTLSVFACSTLLAAQSFAGGARPPAQAKTEVRAPLKKLVQLSSIGAPAIVQNGSLVFDLQTAVNRQMLSAVLETGHFTPKYGSSGTITMSTGGEIEFVASSMPVPKDEEWRCLMDKPQLKISGDILALELESATGANLNLFLLPILPIGGGFSFKTVKSRMTGAFQALDSSERRVLGAATVSDVQKENNTSFNISFQDLAKFGFDYYKKTPLSKVTQSVLAKGVSALNAQTRDLEWEAPVTYTSRKVVGINAGVDAGVRVNDEFMVTNVVHQWSGVPCRSTYLGQRPDVDPVALVKVYDVQATESYAQITEWRNADAGIQAGARVRVEKLYVAPAKK